jgi:mannose-1-phosphate guanylyltransferase/mannose-6-phosphate isomerase
MILVIIAGGSGTRLWPLSTPEYPKHLLKINGDERSILQKTFDRAKNLTDKIYVISEQSHIAEVKKQLPELSKDKFFTEPARRGTANCIVAAIVKLSKDQDPNESVAFIHADHFIRDSKGFVHSFSVASEASNKERKIVLVGVEPVYPSTGFGYIEKNGIYDEEYFIYKVGSFKEKPDFTTAKTYLKSGNYLWNCGYFVGSLATFKSKMEQFAPDLLNTFMHLSGAGDEGFNKAYLELKDMAIDYALIEKVDDLLVVPASFDWMDLGSYTDLSRAVANDEAGNYLQGNVEIEEVKNSYIDNHEAKPVAVIGMDNCVVINTKDGILVAKKDMSQKVGDIAKQIINKKSMGK